MDADVKDLETSEFELLSWSLEFIGIYANFSKEASNQFQKDSRFS